MMVLNQKGQSTGKIIMVLLVVVILVTIVVMNTWMKHQLTETEEVPVSRSSEQTRPTAGQISAVSRQAVPVTDQTVMEKETDLSESKPASQPLADPAPVYEEPLEDVILIN